MYKNVLPGEQQPYFLESGEGQRYLLGPLLATSIGRGQDTGSLMEGVVLIGAKGFCVPLHRHASSHEAIYVLEGSALLRLGDEEFALEGGDYVSVPPGTPHRFASTSHRTRLLTWTFGGNGAAMYEALGHPTEAVTCLAHAEPPDWRKPLPGIDVEFLSESTATTPGKKSHVAPAGVEPYVIPAGEGERMMAGDTLFTFLTDSRQSGGRFLVLMTDGPKGQRIPNHLHEKHTETFFCLNGCVSMTAGEEQVWLRPDDFLHVPARTPHTFQLIGNHTRFIQFHAPGLNEPFSGRTYTEDRSILSILGKEFAEEPSATAIEPWLTSFSVIVIDDVHHLTYDARHELARMMKLWHEHGIKFFLIGIAKSSDEILGTDQELAIRNDVHSLASQSDAFLQEVMANGEAALNIQFAPAFASSAITAAKGLPAIFQAICRIACVEVGIESTRSETTHVDIALPAIGRSVVKMFDPRYFLRLVGLAQGRRHARAVHGTFYEIVDAFARSAKSQISKTELYRKIVSPIADPDAKRRKSTSFYRAMDSLQKAIDERGLSDILIFDSDTLTIDDPVFRFYLDHVDFSRIRALVNTRNDEYEYDVAVSFAGEDRVIVSTFVEALEKRGVEVFYDFNEVARLWGKDLEMELAQIYSNEARFMVICLSDSYPIRDWTRFELEVGRRAAKRRTSDYLLPVKLKADVPPVVGLRETLGYQMLTSPEDVNRTAEVLLAKISNAPVS